MYIYKIINKINGKAYIGQTKRFVELRWKQHCYMEISRGNLNESNTSN